jgi:hypothetical protein
VRAKLLLQVEDREPVTVAEFEPAANGEFWYIPRDYWSTFKIEAALTVEVRELLAEEDPATARVNEDDRDRYAGEDGPR